MSGRVRALKAKVLPTSHFFYRKVTIERPLRLRFEVTQEKVDAFVAAVSDKPGKTSAEKDFEQQTVAAALLRMVKDSGNRTFASMEDFAHALREADLKNSLEAGSAPSSFKGKVFEPVRKAFGVRDKQAEIFLDEKRQAVADSELRDAEYIPFAFIAEHGRHGNDVAACVRAYFDAEVKPHWPDAWVNTDVVDESDAQIGVVGCEINFNREF